MAVVTAQHEKLIFKDILRPQAGDLIIKYGQRYLNGLVLFGFILGSINLLLLYTGALHAFLFYLSLFFMSSYIFSVYVMMFDKNIFPKMGAISDAEKEPEKKKYYYSHFATAVEEFLGQDSNEAKKKNLTESNVLYDVLLDKSVFTMGVLLPGATGAGKTVTMDSAIMLPAIQTGTGFIYIEGKGDKPITEDIVARFTQYGREDSVFILDFAAAQRNKFTHGTNPLEVGTAIQLQQMLINLINILGGDNAWVTDMAKEFMQCLLFPLVALRDMKLFIGAGDCNKIHKLSDFESVDKVIFNITQLNIYLNYQSAIDLLYMFRELMNDPAFMKKLQAQYPLSEDLNLSILKPLELNLIRRGQKVEADNPLKPDYSKTPADQQKQDNYAISPWTEAFLTFGHPDIFGRIVNPEYPDFTFLDAMQQGKSVVVILPSLENARDTNMKIGKFITACIKNALGAMIGEGEVGGTEAEKERGKRLRPKKLPYTLIFDEISNYGSEMLGQISSMCRSIGSDNGGIGMVVAGQSATDLQRIDDNKGIEKDQLLSNLGLSSFLNLSDKGYAEIATGLCGEEYVWMEDRSEIVSRRDESDDIRNLRREKQESFAKDFWSKKLRKQTGEMILVLNGFPVPIKAVSNFVPPPKMDEYKIQMNCHHQKLIKYFDYLNEAA